jgi:ribonuclease P/MRP protein subunit RPP40
VQGQLHEWLLDFLAHQTQTVEYKGILSAPAPVTSGVVQGSVLGPLLFVIFVNDLPNCISTHSWLYADDLKLVGPASTPADNIEAWSNRNQLPLCLTKSQCMHMGPSNNKHVYTIGGSAVPIVQQLTDLGLTCTSDCSSVAHVRGIVGRASRTMGLMWRMFSSRKLTFFMRLFEAYIRPVMEYASSSWNSSRPGLVRELEAIQRRFTKRLRGLGSHTYEARLQHLSLQSLEARRLQADLLMVHKVLTGQIAVTPASVSHLYSYTNVFVSLLCFNNMRM